MIRRLALAALLLPAPAFAQSFDYGEANADFAPAFEAQTRAPILPATPVTTETLTEDLAHPWGIAELPDGTFLITERPGTLRRMTADGGLTRPIEGVPRVDARRQGGLLDVAIAPDFAQSRRIYLTYAKRVDGGTVTAMATGVLNREGTALAEVEDLFIQSPPSRNPMHYGSRVVVEPGTGNLFVTTGEHFSQSDRQLAQDVTTTYGKVVRLTPAGEAPSDNPFIGREGDDLVWSYGHRNVQGAAIGPGGVLWTIEHGPAGGDELNRPEPGLNYGWPVISYGINYNGSAVGSGEARRDGMEQPVYYWDPVIAPGGIAFYSGGQFPWQGDLLAASLNPGALVRLTLENGRVTGEERLLQGVGRIRDVEVTRDGSVLVLVDAPAPYGAVIRLRPGS